MVFRISAFSCNPITRKATALPGDNSAMERVAKAHEKAGELNKLLGELVQKN